MSKLLVINSKNVQKLKELLNLAKNSIKSKLYIKFNQDLPKTDEIVSLIYLNSANICPKLDVRVLVKNQLPNGVSLIDDTKPDTIDTEPPKKYKKVVLGGTFDRLHNGHKVLLTKAAELASEDVVVGVTEKDMIIKKSLFEMIEPVDLRMEKVVDFVEDITFNVKCLAEPIIDPFGPSIRIEDLEAIVVSRETIKGANAVNKKREEKGMRQLDVIVVELVEGIDTILNESKISSSSRRREDLGNLLRPAREIHRKPGQPYVIGLTGGIASGKSNIAKYLHEKHNIEVIDCDKLAHTCYEPGSELCQKIALQFGEDTVVNGIVDRQRLGAIVFGDKAKLQQLSELVWPVIRKRCEEIISKSTSKVVAIEAAALIEAGWHNTLSEVWTVFIPIDEAIKRIMSRDKANESQALSRISAQISNKERIDNSNIVFCSLWKYEETRAQVDKAVANLMGRIEM